jgi:hypothetical protein
MKVKFLIQGKPEDIQNFNKNADWHSIMNSNPAVMIRGDVMVDGEVVDDAVFFSIGNEGMTWEEKLFSDFGEKYINFKYEKTIELLKAECKKFNLMCDRFKTDDELAIIYHKENQFAV